MREKIFKSTKSFSTKIFERSGINKPREELNLENDKIKLI